MAAPARQLGAFEVVAPLGRGGMGEVWSGRHVVSGEAVAIKVLSRELAQDLEFRGAFHREVEAVARLDHPGVVAVLDYGSVPLELANDPDGAFFPGAPFLVMELLTGGSLHRRPPRSWPELRDVLLALLDALAYAHARGVIHRDLKLGNVLFADGDADRPGLRLIDFGIAAAARHDRPPAALGIAGTPAYMAPEQIRGAVRDEGPWTDLYALGCVAYRLASGRPPFEGFREEIYRAHLERDPPPLRPTFDVPRALGAWIARLLEKRPRDRFAFAADAASALRAIGDPTDTTLIERKPRAAFGDDTSTLDFEPAPKPSDLDGAATIVSGPATHAGAEAASRPSISGAGLGLFGLRRLPIVDRERERRVMWDALARVASEREPRLVLLHGPAGTGKSRLAQWLCEHAHERGQARVLEVVHAPIPGPADGVSPMVARHLGCIGLSREEARARILTIAREDGDVDSAEANALLDLVVPKRLDRGGSTARFQLAERHAVVHRLLERIAADRPVILWIDDAQWGPDALELAAYVMRRRAERPIPVLLVLTVRDEALAEQYFMSQMIDELVAGPAAARLAIGPLRPEAHTELVERLLGLSGDLARRVEERTRGNPLFAVHVVGAWVRRGDLLPDRHGFVLRPGAELKLPDDLYRFWSARVDELLAGRPATERVALEIAAVLGQDVDLVEWTRLSARAGARVSEDLVDELVRRRFASRSRIGLVFVHGMVREAIERGAAEAGRAAGLHRLCATALASGAGAPGDAARIGKHLVAAGAADEALEPLCRGARELWAHGDLRASLALLELFDDACARAGAPAHDLRRGEATLVRGLVVKSLGDFSEVDRIGRTLVEEARTHGWASLMPHALHLLGMAAQQRGALDEVAELNEQALALLGDDGDPYGRIDALWALGWVERNRGRLERSQELFESALAIGAALEDPREIAACERGLAQVALRRGDHDAALTHEQRAIAAYEEAGDRMGLVYAHNGTGEIARFVGDLDAAEASYRRAIALGESIGSTEAVVPRLNLGLVLLGRERWREADAELAAASDALERTGRGALQLGAEMGRLAVAGALREDAAWDRAQAAIARLRERVRIADLDFAHASELAGRRAAEAGRHDRARWALGIAREQWSALGAVDRAADVAALLATLA